MKIKQVCEIFSKIMRILPQYCDSELYYTFYVDVYRSTRKPARHIFILNRESKLFSFILAKLFQILQ